MNDYKKTLYIVLLLLHAANFSNLAKTASYSDYLRWKQTSSTTKKLSIYQSHKFRYSTISAATIGYITIVATTSTVLTASTGSAASTTIASSMTPPNAPTTVTATTTTTRIESPTIAPIASSTTAQNSTTAPNAPTKVTATSAIARIESPIRAPIASSTKAHNSTTAHSSTTASNRPTTVTATSTTARIESPTLAPKASSTTAQNAPTIVTTTSTTSLKGYTNIDVTVANTSVSNVHLKKTYALLRNETTLTSNETILGFQFRSIILYSILLFAFFVCCMLTSFGFSKCVFRKKKKVCKSSFLIELLDKNNAMIQIVNSGSRENTVLLVNSETKVLSLTCQGNEANLIKLRESFKPKTHEPLTSFSATSSSTSNVTGQ
jgi:hypothetical protein